MADANALKDQGNKAFQAKDYDKAIDLFTQAIKLDPSNHVLYSNRSAAHAGKKEWQAALEDAEAVCAPLLLAVPVGAGSRTFIIVHKSKSVLVQGLCPERRCFTWRTQMG